MLIKATDLQNGASLLEIGCGTGQATLPMAKRGYNITALEPGDELARLAQQRLEHYPNVNVASTRFEDTSLADESFDLVYAATSFHWLDERTKFSKTHRVLKHAGFLAIIRNEPVSDNSGNIFYEVSKPIFERFGITHNTLLARRISELRPETVDAELFDTPSFFTTDPPVTFSYSSAADYANYLRTLSFVLNMPNRDKDAFLKEIGSLIEAKFDDKLDTNYSATLTLARKK